MADMSRWSQSTGNRTPRSTKSHSTAPTEYSPVSKAQFEEDYDLMRRMDIARERRHTYHQESTKSSYASTLESQDDESVIDLADSYEALAVADEEYFSDVLASSPKNFASFFPSDRRIAIRHDDSTLDGNMNLRLETGVILPNDQRSTITLFHLRMLDLARRDFSLRRYCRDSGREVCSSIRKYQEIHVEQSPVIPRPGLQRSLSSAVASVLRRSSVSGPPSPRLNRTDSGYGSMHSSQTYWDQSSEPKRVYKRLTNTIKLEFSNYAHVDVSRTGRGTTKRYEFEYWGSKYEWRRSIKQEGEFRSVSFHLYRDACSIPSAHIVPDVLTVGQAQEELERGGWVPPCSLWVKDPAIINNSPDIADVIMATGLMALVDDCIKTNWPMKRTPFVLPAFGSQPRYIDLQLLTPKKLIDEAFNRPGVTGREPLSLQRRRTAF